MEKLLTYKQVLDLLTIEIKELSKDKVKNKVEIKEKQQEYNDTIAFIQENKIDPNNEYPE